MNFVLRLVVQHIWNQVNQSEVALQVTIWISSILSLVVTVVCAAQVARKVKGEPKLHGFLVGLIATLLLFLLSSGFQGRFALVILITSVLTIAAGWFGGVLGSRGR